jgi:hypothetical protein
MKFNFWQKWLLISAILTSIFGLMMVLGINSEGFNAQFNPAFWGTDTPGIQVRNYQQWIMGVLGSAWMSWGIFIVFIASVPFNRKEKWARNCLLLGIVSWYILDTIISLKANVGTNALLNTVFAAMLLIPICFTFNKFNYSKKNVNM